MKNGEGLAGIIHHMHDVGGRRGGGAQPQMGLNIGHSSSSCLGSNALWLVETPDALHSFVLTPAEMTMGPTPPTST